MYTLGLGCKVIQGATQFSVDSWDWDAFIRSLAVAPRTGRGLSIHVQLPQSRGASLKVTHARAAATRRPRSHLQIMAAGSGLKDYCLDRLFLELLKQLPTEGRGKLAQLADEVKRLTESSTAKAPVTPPSSADQTVVRREEETATTEAKQSPLELQA